MLSKAKKKYTGDFKQRLTVQKEELVSDGMGGQFPEWVEDFKIWGNIKPVSGSERLHLDAIDSTVTHRIQTRFTKADLTNRRIGYKGREFNIHYHLSPDEERAYTELGAAEKI
jgi:SPP1 family predicted phage head-tail adaptor